MKELVITPEAAEALAKDSAATEEMGAGSFVGTIQDTVDGMKSVMVVDEVHDTLVKMNIEDAPPGTALSDTIIAICTLLEKNRSTEQ